MSAPPVRDDVGECKSVGDVFVGADVGEDALEGVAVGTPPAREILSIFASVEDLGIFWNGPKLPSAVSSEDLAGR